MPIGVKNPLHGPVLESHAFGNARVAIATRDEAISQVIHAIRERKQTNFGFCNAHTVVTAQRNRKFRAALSSITLFNDGIGMDIAKRLLYASRFSSNLNGTDFTPEVLAALTDGTRVYLLGSPPTVAAIAAKRLGDQFSNVQFVGFHDGYFPDEHSATIAQSIAAQRINLLLIGMGHPRQELWAAQWGPSTGAVILCVGAFLDFAAERITRAPQWIRRLHAEWIFRLSVEPRRLAKRYLIGNFKFFQIVLRQKIRRSAADP